MVNGRSHRGDTKALIPHSAGKALTFIKEKVLTWESGMRKNVPKVLVVVTDGRSQDEVKKAAFVIQQSGKHKRGLYGIQYFFKYERVIIKDQNC